MKKRIALLLALLMTLSLCAYSFGSERRFGANIGIHATYYAAQLLIAWSIFFM